MQLKLYSTDTSNCPGSKALQPPVFINGFNYTPEFISAIEHDYILDEVNKVAWLHDLKRRVQHYGYKYDYKKRSLDYSMYLGELPTWTEFITKRILMQGYMLQAPDQLIVNEYKPGQGIADHIDCEPCFDDTIVSLSLGSTCVMDFKNKINNKDKYEVLLQPRSLVVIKGDARYCWTHGISSREKDKWLGETIVRSTRVSLTFRNVIMSV